MNGNMVRILQPPGTDFKQQYKTGGDPTMYTSEARDPQNMANKMAPQMHGQGTTPGYTGHVPRVKTHALGATTHSMPKPDASKASKGDSYAKTNMNARGFQQTALVKGPDSQFFDGLKGALA